jgi:flagellar biosynthesis protein FlhA
LPAKDPRESLLKVEPLAIEVGLGLVKLVEGGQNSPLLRKIAAIRRQTAADLGYMVPPVRVTDNLQLKAGQYVVHLKGVEIARFEILQNCELALDPAFGIPALWIPAAQADHARAQGYTVVDAVGVIGAHLAQLIRRHAHELLSRQDTKNILDRVAVDNPKVVEDLVPKLLPLASVQKVLQNLLRERVSIRDSVTIYAEFRPGKLIFTRLDELSCHGAPISEAAGLGIPVSFLSWGRRIPEDLEPATRRRLVELIPRKAAARARGAGAAA